MQIDRVAIGMAHVGTRLAPSEVLVKTFILGERIAQILQDRVGRFQARAVH